MNAKKISTNDHEAEFPEPVKIIQIIQNPDSAMLIGLGDDGVVYASTWRDKKWLKLVPLEFCEEVNNEA